MHNRKYAHERRKNFALERIMAISRDSSSIGRRVSATDVGVVKALTISEEPNIQAITIIGLDIANSVFQSMASTQRECIIRRQLKPR